MRKKKKSNEEEEEETYEELLKVKYKHIFTIDFNYWMFADNLDLLKLL